MAEWLKAAVLKTVVPQGTVGSNPTSSAIFLSGCRQVVRHKLPKLIFAGSIPVTRSRKFAKRIFLHTMGSGVLRFHFCFNFIYFHIKNFYKLLIRFYYILLLFIII